MKECPNCQMKIIPLKWILFNESANLNGKCFQCPNCDCRVKKSKWFIFYLLSADLLIEGTWILIATAFMGKWLGSYSIAFLSILLFWTVLHFSVEYFAPLKLADESHCRGDLSQVGAFFALMFMLIMI